MILLLGLTALGAYSVGRQDMRTVNAPSVPAVRVPAPPAKPLALTAVPSNVSQPQPSSVAPIDINAARSKTPQEPAPQQGDAKRRVEVVLTATAIAAILIKASRDQYHATRQAVRLPG